MNEPVQAAGICASAGELDDGPAAGPAARRPIAIAICHFLPEGEYLGSEHCIPVQLGFGETGWDLGIQRDDQGDNRSDKHPLYSEYSGFYWLWKNVDAGYKGVFQHRRAFTLEKVPLRGRAKQLLKNAARGAINIWSHHPYMYNEMVPCASDSEYREKLSAFLAALPGMLGGGCDVVVPRPCRFRRVTVGEHFDEVVTRVMLASLRSCMRERFPEYAPFFERTWNGFELYYANINVMRSDLYDAYCGFAFGVFDALEADFVGKGYFIDPVNERFLYRTFGYVGELLMTAFVLKCRADGVGVREATVLFNASAKANETTDYDRLRSGASCAGR